MRKSIIIIAIAALSMSMAPGCSHLTVLRTREIHATQDTLKMEIAALEKKISEQQEQQAELLRLIRADQQVRFNELEKRVGEVGSSLTESQYRL
jgi:septal ring factor EnvC (AmiA/AmiB activator)